MIVTEAEGRFVTQRQESKLAIIETRLPQNASLHGSKGHPEPTAALILSAPEMTLVEVSFACLSPHIHAKQLSILALSCFLLRSGPMTSGCFTCFFYRCRFRPNLTANGYEYDVMTGKEML